MKTAVAALAFGVAVLQAAVAPTIGPKEAFEQLTQLAGTWEGTARSPQGSAATVHYRVTAGGTAVMETLFPGTDHEMVTIYYLDGEQLVLTHYCAMGNQPHMRLDPAASTVTELRFVFDGGTNLDPKKDAHIHSGRIAWTGEGRIESEWVVYKEGKEVAQNRFFLTRKPE